MLVRSDLSRNGDQVRVFEVPSACEGGYAQMRKLGSIRLEQHGAVRFFTIGSPACALLSLLLSGCFAQQADLAKLKYDLDKRITRLDQREKEIDRKADEANRQIDKIKKDADQLVSETRARLRHEIADLKEDSLPKLQGKLDENRHSLDELNKRLDDRLVSLDQISRKRDNELKADRDRLQEELGKVATRLDAVQAALGTFGKTLDARLEEHDKAISAGDARTGSVEKKLDAQLTQFGKSLADFKQAMNGLGEKIVQEDHKLSELTNTLTQRANALEALGGKLVSRAEEQDQRLDEMTRTLQATGVRPPAGSATRKGKEAGKSHQEQRSAPRGDQPRARDSAISATDSPVPTSHDGVATTSVAAVPGTDGGSALSEAKNVYERNMQKFKGGDLNGAQQGFSQFLVHYGTSDLAPNAQYWLGECYYGKKEYKRAIDAFERVELDYPTSDKVPAAILKRGFAYLALNDRKRASTLLRQVVDTYPKSQEANALDKLTQLKNPG